MDTDTPVVPSVLPAQVMGTLNYMAPAVYRDNDIWRFTARKPGVAFQAAAGRTTPLLPGYAIPLTDGLTFTLGHATARPAQVRERVNPAPAPVRLRILVQAPGPAFLA